MTRPRSAQLNYPATRYTSYTLPVSPSSGSDQVIFPSPVSNFTITKQTGGAETALPAALLATVGEPTTGFSIPVSGTLTVSMNDGTSATISLVQGSTLRLQQIIDSINAAFTALNPSVTVAVADRTFDQYLILRSANSSGYIMGVGASVTVTSNRIALLALFGFDVTNSATGIPLQRGVVTNAFDLLGGKIYFSRADGYDLMAVSNRVLPDLYAKNTFSPEFISASRPDKRVYARCISAGSQDIFGICRVEAYTAAPFKTTNANCAALTTGDSFEITAVNRNTGNSATIFVTIGASNPTSEDVATYINDAFNTATDCSTPYWTSTVSEPFFLNGSFTLRFSGTYIPVNLDSSLRTAQQIADKINVDIAAAGASADGVASAIDGRVLISSSLGVNSFVEISAISDPDFSRAFGIQNGQFRAFNICMNIGSELYFNVPFDCNLSFNNASLLSTLKNLGVTSANVLDVTLPVDIKEVRVLFPNLTSTTNSSETNYITAQIPELMEAGDVPAYQFSEERQSDFQSAYKRNQISVPNIFETSGSVLFNNDNGFLNEAVVPYSISTGRIGQATFAQEFPEPTYLPAPVIYSEIAKKGLTTVNYKLFAEIAPEDSNEPYVRIASENNSPNSSLILSSNARPSVDSNVLKYSLDRSTSPASATVLSNDSFGIYYQDSASVPWDSSSWNPSLSFIKVGDTTYGSSIAHALQLADGGVFFQQDSSLKLADAQTTNNVSVQLKNVPLTSISIDCGDNALRVSSIPAATSVQTYKDRYSVIRSLNARHTITCGDGVNSFGDFNGPNAFEDASTFISDQSISDAYIILKPGDYSVTDTVAFSNCNIMIDGYGANVLASTSAAPQITFQNAADGKGTLKINGVNFATNGNYNVNAQGGFVSLQDCSFNSGIYLAASASTTPNYSRYGIGALYAKNCFFMPGGGKSTCVELTKASTSNFLVNSVLFDQCYFDPRDGGTNKRTCIITGLSGGNASTTFKDIGFRNCEFKLSSYTAISNNRMSVNTGLIELDPLTNVRTGSGLRITRLVYDSCRVDATSNGLNCIMQLSSGLTSNNVTATSNYAIVDELVFNNCDISLRLSSSTTADYSLGFVVGHSVQKCVMSNCKYSYTNANNTSAYGNPPVWVLNVAVDLPISGHICFLSKQTIINNLDVTGCVAVSANNANSGADIAFAYGSKLELKNINLSWLKPDGTIANGNGSFSPRSRIVVCKIYTVSSPIYELYGNAIVEDVNLIGPNATPTGRWANTSIIYNIAKDIIYKNIIIKSFLNPSVAGSTYGIYAVADAGYSNYSSNISIDQCTIEDVDRGVMVYNPTTTSAVSNIRIIHNNIKAVPTGLSTKATGVIVESASPVKDGLLQINDNFIEVSGTAYTTLPGPISTTDYRNVSAGILVTTGSLGTGITFDDAISRTVVSRNLIKTTAVPFAPGFKVPGIYMVPIPAGDIRPQSSICRDNTVYSYAGTASEFETGNISISEWNDTTAQFTAVLLKTQSSDGMIGYETGYTVSAGTARLYEMANGVSLLHNHAILNNSNVP